jgi:hypothetical protein
MSLIVAVWLSVGFIRWWKRTGQWAFAVLAASGAIYITFACVEFIVINVQSFGQSAEIEDEIKRDTAHNVKWIPIRMGVQTLVLLTAGIGGIGLMRSGTKI